MSQTRNQVTTTAPDANSAAYLGQARDAANTAYQTTINSPYYQGSRSAGIDPLQYQAAGYAGQQASLFGGAANGLESQAGYGQNANNYFDAQQQAGYGGLQQQQGAAQGGYGAQNFLGAGQQAGYGGLGTVGQANSLFGQGAYGQLNQAAQLNPYLAQSQALTQNGAPQALAEQAYQGQQANAALGQYGGGAAQHGYNAATSALQGGPDINQFMNPYQQNVTNALQGQFDHVRKQTLNSIGDQAQAAGAYGGDRASVASGAALADIARNETSQLSQIQQQGYAQALQAAQQQQQFRAQAGQSLFGQGLGAIGQQAGYGQNALGQLSGLYGQGLSNLGNAGTNASNTLYGSGLGAGQYLAGYGQQNANTLYNGANNAGQYLGTQGSYGANQQGQFANNALSSLFGAGIGGSDRLGQYGQQFQGYGQNAIDRNVAAIQDPITRQQQALGYFGQIGVPQGGQTQTTPMTSNGWAAGLGLLGTLGGAFLGGPAGAGIGAGVGSKLGNFVGGGDKFSNSGQ